MVLFSCIVEYNFTHNSLQLYTQFAALHYAHVDTFNRAADMSVVDRITSWQSVYRRLDYSYNDRLEKAIFLFFVRE